MPPEVITRRKFSKHSDVWSFGVTCWEIFNFALQIPYWEHDTNNEVKVFVVKGGRLEKPAICPNDVWSLITSCWSDVPRPSFENLHKGLMKIVNPQSVKLSVNYD
jgi:serine/threonine protein kinase